MKLDEPFIDAHQHFWDLSRNRYPWLQDDKPIGFRYGDYTALKRNYLPAEFARDTDGFTPAATVHIEAEWDRAAPVAETKWLTEIARETGRPSACVAHAALDQDDVEDVLAAQADYSLVRGIRHKPVTSATRADARRGLRGSMDDERWRRGFAMLERHGFSFDLQAPWWNLDQAMDLARDFPRTQIIINHAALPADRSAEGLAGWRAALERIAQCPNVAITPGLENATCRLSVRQSIFSAPDAACSPATIRWIVLWRPIERSWMDSSRLLRIVQTLTGASCCSTTRNAYTGCKQQAGHPSAVARCTGWNNIPGVEP
jgi:predicted TIM-barrel fold metal-dependent hydrolase